MTTDHQLDQWATLAITAEHNGTKIDPAIVTTLVDEVRRLRFQSRFLLDHIAKRSTASGRSDEALRQFLAAEHPAVDPSQACGKCKQPFDPADTRFDGQARFYLTPYCRACVDRCTDTEIADHRCVICA